MAAPDAAALAPPRPALTPRAARSRGAPRRRRRRTSPAARRRRAAPRLPASRRCARSRSRDRPHRRMKTRAASHGDAARLNSSSGRCRFRQRPARGGAASPGAADGGAGDDPNSIAHADYASNPPPCLSRRRAPPRAARHRHGPGADRRRRLRRARRDCGLFRLRFARRRRTGHRPLAMALRAGAPRRRRR